MALFWSAAVKVLATRDTFRLPRLFRLRDGNLPFDVTLCRANPIPEVVLQPQHQGESLDETSGWHTQMMREAAPGA
jgi:hypothetical protein